jgi:hypothetical protein
MVHERASGQQVPRQEPLQVATIPVVWTATGLLGLVISSLAIMFLVFWWRTGSLPSEMVRPDPIVFPDPKLQIRQSRDLARIGQRDEERLHTQAALPIEQAMQRIVARGRAAYDPLVAAPKNKQSVP